MPLIYARLGRKADKLGKKAVSFILLVGCRKESNGDTFSPWKHLPKSEKNEEISTKKAITHTQAFISQPSTVLIGHGVGYSQII
jgi:hypothetical protein